jgi:Tfp pilus assembly protein PilX
MASATKRCDDESGATLILALIFMSVVSLITLSMAAWATTGLRSTQSFTKAQSTVATANSVAELALQESRYTFQQTTLWADPPVPCWPVGTSSTQTLNYLSMSAWCQTRWFPSSPTTTRKVTIDVCLSTFSAASCAATPYLQAIVTFDDFPSSGGSPVCTPDNGATSTGWATCGTYMKINSWVFGANPPAVTAAQEYAASGSCTTSDFWVSGTGFLSGSTNVYLISSNGNSNNITLSPTNLNVQSSTYLTACLPTGGTGGSSLMVMVSTPLGQSSQSVSIPY